MDRNVLNPPAIIRQVESRHERKAKIKAMYLDDVRTTLERARDRGKELSELRKQCQDEGAVWTKELDEIGVPRSTAHRDIRIWDNWTSIQEEMSTRGHMTPAQANIWLVGKMKGEAEEESPEADDQVDGLGHEDGNQSEPPLCPRCQSEGAVEGCPSCADLRQGGAARDPKRTKKKTATRPRRRKSSQNGKEQFNWREFRANYGAVVRIIDNFANSYSVKDTAAHGNLLSKLDEIQRELKQWFERVTKQKAPE